MLHLTREQFNIIVEQGRAGKPLEICGLLTGQRRELAGNTASYEGEVATQVVEVHPADSEDRSEKTYTLNGTQQVLIEKQAREQGREVVGIYHTHPATQPYPSPTDVARAHWGDTDDLLFPEYSYLIVSLRDPANPEPRSYKIRGRRIPEDIVEEAVVIE